MFSVYDIQCARYMSTGLNSKTREEAIEAMKDYLSIDHSEKELEHVDEEYLGWLEFEIVEHEEELEDELKEQLKGVWNS